MTQADWATVGIGSSLHPLDAALDYIRERGGPVLGLYLVAMVPFSVAVLFLIDAVTIPQRAALPFGCALLAGATLWRWGFLGAAQRRVQADLRGEPPLPLRRRLGMILVAKLMLSIVVLWGGLLVVPAFYGAYVSGIAVPLLLESDGHVGPLLRKACGWVHRARRRLTRMGLALSAALALAFVATLALHWFLMETVLPSLLGLNVEDLWLTLRGKAWGLCATYFLFLGFDFYWTVASVMVFYDLQARQLGSDLRLRLRLLSEARR